MSVGLSRYYKKRSVPKYYKYKTHEPRTWPIAEYWRHMTIYMVTSSNRNIFIVTGLCEGNSTVTSEFPSQRPVTRSFYVFFDLSLNKRLGKRSWGWWLERPSRSLWSYCYETLAQVMAHYLNQCWPIVNEVLGHSPETNLTGSAHDTNS